MNYIKKNTECNTWGLGLILVAVTLISLGGCKKKADPPGDGLGGGRVCESLAASSEAFAKAQLAYSANPSVANCQKMKETGEDYRSEVQKCEFATQEVREKVEEWWAEWKDVDCSAYAEDGN